MADLANSRSKFSCAGSPKTLLYNRDEGLDMNKSNLRFLLALGNQTVVAVKEKDQIKVYTKQRTTSPNVSVKKLSTLITR